MEAAMLEPLPPEAAGRRAGIDDGAPHERVVEPLPQLPEGFIIMPVFFPPIRQGCRAAGISETWFYGVAAKIDPGVIIQLGGRSHMDFLRTLTLIATHFPRGPRKPLQLSRAGNGKGRRKTPPKSARSSLLATEPSPARS
jgi:hypothetical protein